MRGSMSKILPSLTKNFASRCQSWRDSWQDCTKIFATVNLLPGENLGEICGSIPARFWPLGLLLPGENLGKIRGRIAPRFWPLGFFLLGENLGEIRGRIPARFWLPGFLLLGENLGEFRGRIPVRFWPLGMSLPGENLAGTPARFLPGRKIPAAKILPGSQRDSRRDRGGIPPRSRSLFYKGARFLKPLTIYDENLQFFLPYLWLDR